MFISLLVPILHTARKLHEKSQTSDEHYKPKHVYSSKKVKDHFFKGMSYRNDKIEWFNVFLII